MTLQHAFLFAAFWTGVARYRGERPLRFVAGLGLGALLAHVGWRLLQADPARDPLAAGLDPAAGFSLLFVPLGLLVCERSAAALRALPLALAVARAGCLAAGCCAGPHGEPVPALEIAGWIALHVAARRAPDSAVAPLVLAGFGALRLLLEPLRAAPSLGPPVVPVEALAAAWLVLGLALALQASSSWRTFTPASRSRSSATSPSG